MRVYAGVQLANPMITQERRAMVVFAIVSLLLHLLILSLPLPEQPAVSRPQAFLPVEFLPLAQPTKKPEREAEKKQIVSPSEVKEEQEPELPSRFLSERSSRVSQQTVHHGMPAQGTTVDLDETTDTPPRIKKKRAVKDAPSKLAVARLFSSPAELVRNEKKRAEEARRTKPKEAQRKAKVDLNLGGESALSSFSGGVPDYLPDIRPGQVTLLNAKANRFAPFVRRVGLRVFQHLVIAQRRLDAREIFAAQGQAVVRAVLDPDGQLVELTTETLSGSSGLDRTLKQACKKGAFDNNPPESAKRPDGNYEFRFEARLRPWSFDGQHIGRVDSFLSIRLL